ncbi:MAG: tRNA pseudouridine(55) synthase TruB [Alphaproteobacteria bacterium]|nr:tRNA pseudouridine(55) synthase TruB [Alphaproteobacteria bacterium]
MKGAKLHGWLVLDKPVGLTSVQALGRARRLLGGGKAGHGGTLDPLASGVLPLAFGEATKIIAHVMDGTKIYEFTVLWGQQRSTDDAEGEIIAVSDARPTEKEVLAALPFFVGDILQTPPAFSALKIAGQRAYDLARKGQEVDLRPRKVQIDRLDLIKADKEGATLRLACGKGTYVRALARDLALKLGSLGYVGALRRLAAGNFGIAQAISVEKLEELAHKGAAQTALLSVGSALDDIPGLTLTASEAQTLRNGNRLLLRRDQLHLIKEPLIAAFYQEEPVALVRVENGALCVVRGFRFS